MAAGTPLDANGVSRVPERRCPACNYTLDAAGIKPDEVDPRPPEPGDFTVCMRCRVVLTYTDTMGVRVLTNAEWAALEPDERVGLTKLRDTIAQMHRATGWPGTSATN